MNGLYGKMLQKAQFKKTMIADKISKIFDFMDDYDITGWEILNDNKILLIGEINENRENDVITKPAQYGSYVLGYSRRIMLFYNKIIDEDLNKFIVSYIDTDSLHVPAEIYYRLKHMGYIRKGEMGYLSNDIKKNGMIFHEKNLGPKSCIYKYINNENEIKTVMKTKGIPKKQLKEEYYMNETGDVKFNTMKKIKFNVTSNEKNNGNSYLSIYNYTMNRLFNLNEWCGRELKGNLYYPIGYEN